MKGPAREAAAVCAATPTAKRRLTRTTATKVIAANHGTAEVVAPDRAVAVAVAEEVVDRAAEVVAVAVDRAGAVVAVALCRAGVVVVVVVDGAVAKAAAGEALCS